MRDDSGRADARTGRAASTTPIVLVVGAGAVAAALARILGDAGYAVIAVPQMRQVRGLATGGVLGPVVVDLAAGDPLVLERMRRAVAAAGGLVIGVLGGLDEGARRALRRRLALFAIHDPDDGLERFLDLVDTAVDLGHERRRRRMAHAARVAALGRVCHELRASLDVLDGYADLLADPPASPAAARGARDGLRSASRRSHALVETYAALVCAETRAPRLGDVETGAVVHALRRHVAIRARYAPCVLRVDAVQAVAVRTDGERLHALLSHLVDAAIGRSAEACARLRVWRTDALLRFEIASVADASGAVAVAGRAAPRTPLEHLPGVIIARRLAQILGASVEVRALGDGARFDVALPVATPVAPTVH